MLKQFIKFGIVGSIGFIIDASVLLLLVEKFSFSIEYSRVFSFLIAVFVTWFLNRNFTFSKAQKFNKKGEYFLYLIIQSIGVLLNYLIFIALINYNVFFKEYLIISLAISSIIVMSFNFYMLKIKIYK